jgi:membrane associated rhomboid family serine protease
MKYSWLVLLPACLNFWFGYFLWRTGTEPAGAIFGAVFPVLGLLALFSILRPGYFFSTTYDEGHPKHVVSPKNQPGSFWTMVAICIVWYLAVTFVIGAVVYERLTPAS